MHWWVELATSGFMGMVLAGFLAVIAGGLALGVLAGVLHGIAFTRDNLTRGFRRGWDRDTRDTASK
jgi:hypothetical protein